MFNEMTYFNAVAETVEDLLPKLDEWGGPYTFPHMASAGRWPSTRRSPGPSRWPPTSAARATAWSFTGRRASRRRVGFAASLATSSTWPHRSRGGHAAGAQERQRHAADAHGGHEPALLLQRRRRPRSGTRPSTSRSSATARSITRAGSPARPPRAVGDARSAAARIRHLGALPRAEDFSLADNLADSIRTS